MPTRPRWPRWPATSTTRWGSSARSCSDCCGCCTRRPRWARRRRSASCSCSGRCTPPGRAAAKGVALGWAGPCPGIRFAVKTSRGWVLSSLVTPRRGFFCFVPRSNHKSRRKRNFPQKVKKESQKLLMQFFSLGSRNLDGLKQMCSVHMSPFCIFFGCFLYPFLYPLYVEPLRLFSDLVSAPHKTAVLW